ncbi:MAG: guanylate kinase [Acidobacteria bacterium]|nr:guanylate kinase [Acidobacteriota bacterium]
MAGALCFIVSGPSGSGKTTVVEHLLARVPTLLFSVSYTTRAPRGGEQNGREYFFVQPQEFEQMVARNELLEYARVFGEYYGTHRRVLDQAAQQGKDLLLDIDVQGAQQVKSRLPAAVAVLLIPPSADELERRLCARGQDAPDVIQRRLRSAREEIESYGTYDYLVINRELGDTCAQVEAIVVVERARRAGQPPEPSLEAQAATARREATKSRVSAILETFGAHG